MLCPKCGIDASSCICKVSDLDGSSSISDELTSQSGPSIEERTADKKKEAVLNLINDVKTQREDIDNLNKSVSYMAEQMPKLAQMIDNQTAALNQVLAGQGPATAGPGQVAAAPGLDMEKIGMIGDILEKGISAYKAIKGDGPGPQPLISQEIINQKMQQNFMDNLETGESITNFIKDSLKKNVTKKIINSSLGEIGNNIPGNDAHGPQ